MAMNVDVIAETNDECLNIQFYFPFQDDDWEQHALMKVAVNSVLNF